jgi:hypothetical protein
VQVGKRARRQKGKRGKKGRRWTAREKARGQAEQWGERASEQNLTIGSKNAKAGVGRREMRDVRSNGWTMKARRQRLR